MGQKGSGYREDDDSDSQADPSAAKAVSESFRSAMLFPPKEQEKIKAELLRKKLKKQPG